MEFAGETFLFNELDNTNFDENFFSDYFNDFDSLSLDPQTQLGPVISQPTLTQLQPQLSPPSEIQSPPESDQSEQIQQVQLQHQAVQLQASFDNNHSGNSSTSISRNTSTRTLSAKDEIYFSSKSSKNLTSEEIGFFPIFQKNFKMSLHPQVKTDGSLKQPTEIIQMATMANQISQQKIRSLFQRQRMFIQSFQNQLAQEQQQDLSSLQQQLLQVRQELEKQVHALAFTNQTSLLDPLPLHQMYYLHQEITLQMKQLELLHCELVGIKNYHINQCLAVLMISSQPFPVVITKGNQLSSSVLVVKLLTSAGIDISQVTPVRAKMVCEAQALGKGSPIPVLTNDEQTLDVSTMSCSFPLKFNHGTRKSVVCLTFSMMIQNKHPNNPLNNSIHPWIVQSPKSEPFIVITNDTQWEDAVFTLLKKDSFVSQTEITWTQMCNTLQRHFLRSTRQNPANPDRFLSRLDFNYFHEKFFWKWQLYQPKVL
eukprot:TRINITY_DN2307_c1_g2_i1.p1 TRINITY_DN2307_c1_g2~~TRINITY_DN2307_c1_g2_i1.p1  ORF type:complete len:493 (+),score=114.28 TRINITY_DN2307_c1_g2_i1:35-1480(+)